MIHLLLGSDDDHRVHLHIVTTPDEAMPWRPGVWFTSRRAGDCVFAGDTDLTPGSTPISTVSLVETDDLEPDWSLLPPSAPHGEQIGGEEMLLRLSQEGSAFHLRMTTTLLQPAGGLVVTDPGRVRMLVQTHTMGRAEMEIDVLECAAEPAGGAAR